MSPETPDTPDGPKPDAANGSTSGTPAAENRTAVKPVDNSRRAWMLSIARHVAVYGLIIAGALYGLFFLNR